jgi:small subunit ribosomal protein S20
MAHSVSALKRVRQNEKHRQRNKSVTSGVRTVIKKFRTMCAEGHLDEARGLYPGVAKKIDQAAAKGILHKNSASRYKSRLALLLNRSAAATTAK